MIKQTGFLYKLQDTDYITGASPIPAVEVNPTADWTLYLPSGEKQYKYATFDTFSCTTFSFLNAIETSINWLVYNHKLSDAQVTTLKELGFYATKEFNCSDRFTAITSGTMPNGNYFQAIGDAVRKYGLLPEWLLPFGGDTQAEYLDKTKITQEMYDRAKKILDIIDVAYEWTDVTAIPTTLKQCPVWGAIPEQASHAVMIPVSGKYFDSYEPYLKDLPTVRYAMKVIVTAKKPVKIWKYFKLEEFTNSQKTHTVRELNTDLVDKLDIIRGECGFPFIINSGFRSKIENDNLIDAVGDSSHLSGKACDIQCLDDAKRFKIIQSALKNGIKRIGIAKTYIHLDIDESKPQQVVWLYN